MEAEGARGGEQWTKQPGESPPTFMPLSCPCSVLIRFISNPTAPSWWGFLVAGLMFVCSVMQTLFLHQANRYIFVMGLRLRTGIIGAIYRKVSWGRALRGQGGWPWGALESVTGPVHHLLSTCRPWSSVIQSDVSPLWGKSSTSCQWMPSTSWTSPPSSTCCGPDHCRSSWPSTSSGR